MVGADGELVDQSMPVGFLGGQMPNVAPLAVEDLPISDRSIARSRLGQNANIIDEGVTCEVMREEQGDAYAELVNTLTSQ